MIAKTYTCSLLGIDGLLVEVGILGTPFIFLYLRALQSPVFHDPRFSYLFGPPD
jgi:hypothetical protein